MAVPAVEESRYWPLRRYLDLYERSLEDPEAFWAGEARKLDWYRTWDKVLEWDPPFAKWFVGGELNACYQCVDRHANSRRKSTVAIFQSQHQMLWPPEKHEKLCVYHGPSYDQAL